MAFGQSDLTGSIILTVGQVAKQLGWSVNKTKRWLTNDGILRKQRCGKYGRCYTTVELLRLTCPETVDRILAGIPSIID